MGYFRDLEDGEEEVLVGPTIEHLPVWQEREMRNGKLYYHNITTHEQSLSKPYSFERASSQAVVSPSDLCFRCRDLNLGNQLSNWASNRAGEMQIKGVNSYIFQSVRHCRLCELFVRLLPPNFRGNDSNTSYLISIHSDSRRVEEPLFRMLDLNVLVLSSYRSARLGLETPCVAVHPGRHSPWLKKLEPLIDFEVPRKWLKLCKELHADGCGQANFESLANFHLIFCSTGKVVEATGNEEYVALSYVWGKDTGIVVNDSEYPKTIRHAMMVTQELGFQYLWVDKYCINQDDWEERHHQLQQMDSIYQKAVVTIVAAAGSNPHYGLPGVGERLRQPSYSLFAYGFDFSGLLRVPRLRSDHCVWMSRGWTYQEGLLSTRRLIFTDEQVYFECQGCYCPEMIDLPIKLWAAMHKPGEPRLDERYCEPGRIGLFPGFGFGQDPWDVFERITEYTKRNLTDENDILNGIIGIFKAFERQKDPIRHLFGLPFSHKALTLPNDRVLRTEKDHPFPTLSEGLRWTLAKPSKRREGFPSWSWTGWFGEITWPREYTNTTAPGRTLRRLHQPADSRVNENCIQVLVELNAGGRNVKLKWPDFQNHYDTIGSTSGLTGILYILAYTSVARLRDNPRLEPEECLFELECEEGAPVSVLAEQTTLYGLQSQDSFLVVHFHRTGSSESNQRHVLIVQDMGNHWERVAIGAYSGVDLMKNVRRHWQYVRLG